MTRRDDSYWPSPWPAEDGGPRRRQVPDAVGGLGLVRGDRLEVTSRFAPAATMVVLRDPGEVFLLRHTAGDEAVSFVERIEPTTLAPLARSVDLAAGPVWPGGLAAHADGSLHVVFGNHAHRLGADLELLATARLPREAPYNSFVLLPDGHLVTKDFAGSRPGVPVPEVARRPCELVVLDPVDLRIVDTLALTEPSIARLSADGDEIVVVGDTSLLQVRWTGSVLEPLGDPIRYRTKDGQTYGWDCVLADGAAWFLDDGEGSDSYDGTLRGHGVSTAPLCLVRADLRTGRVTTGIISGRPGGLVANPPVVDEQRSIAVGYDSGNGVLRAFDVNPGGELTSRWVRDQDHGGHLVLFADTGELVTGDHDAQRGAEQVVVLDVESGQELARADTGSPVQSVLFPAAGFDQDLYLCSFTTVSRVVRSSRPHDGGDPAAG